MWDFREKLLNFREKQARKTQKWGDFFIFNFLLGSKMRQNQQINKNNREKY